MSCGPPEATSDSPDISVTGWCIGQAGRVGVHTSKQPSKGTGLVDRYSATLPAPPAPRLEAALSVSSSATAGLQWN